MAWRIRIPGRGNAPPTMLLQTMILQTMILQELTNPSLPGAGSASGQDQWFGRAPKAMVMAVACCRGCHLLPQQLEHQWSDHSSHNRFKHQKHQKCSQCAACCP